MYCVCVCVSFIHHNQPLPLIIHLFLHPHTLYRWLEQDPIELLESVRLCIGGVADSLRLEDTPISSIHGVGITNQRKTTILWDKLTGVPFYNAIGDYCSGWSLYVIIK